MRDTDVGLLSRFYQYRASEETDMRVKFAKLAVVLAGLIVLVSPADPQLITGSIVGTVQDPSAMAVPGAEAMLTQVATGAVRRTETDVSGNFLFGGLDPGEYTLTVSKSGFKKAERKDLILSTGERVSAGMIALEVGMVSEVISVTSQPGAVVQTESAERVGIVTTAQMENLMVMGRDFKTLASLVPGVVVAYSGGNSADPDSIQRGEVYHVLGNRESGNNATLDGATVGTVDYPVDNISRSSMDSIAEVRVLVGSYAAEYGGRIGGSIDVVLKSGTRDFHGLGSYFKRHEQFDANNFFNNRGNVPIPRYRYNTWTYNLGGPVYIPGKFNRNKDRLFFFWSQEFWPQSTGNVTRITVPTALERAGDFSQTLNLNNQMIVIKDPTTGAPFPGNQIPSNRLDKSGQALLNFFPLPNFLNRQVSLGQYNFVTTVNYNSPTQYDTLKLDYNPNSSNSFGITSNYLTGNGVAVGATVWPQMISSSSPAKEHAIVARYTHIFSSRALNEFNFGWADTSWGSTVPAAQIQRNLRSTVGFTAGQLYPAANPYNFIPSANFTGVPGAANLSISESSWYTVPSDGSGSWQGRVSDEGSYNWSDKFTYVLGPHVLKTGISYLRAERQKGLQSSMTVGASSPWGLFDFGADASNSLDTGYAYSNAALGVFDWYRETSQHVWTHALSNSLEAFMQDDWRVTHRLTLHYGLRLSWFPRIHDKTPNLFSAFVPQSYDPSQQVRLIQPALIGGNRVGFDPVTRTQYPAALIGALVPGVGNPYDGIVTAAQNTNYPSTLADNPGVLFAPRFGFSYDVFGKGKTAVRGGFGYSYNRDSMDCCYKPFTGQPPQATTPMIQYGQLSQVQSAATFLFPIGINGRYRSEDIPTAMNYSFSIQQAVGFGTVLDVAYVGALGRHLIWRENVNSVPLGADFQPQNIDPTKGTVLPSAFLRRVVGYQDITMQEAGGTSNYHSLQVSARKRFARGLSFGLAWTWSKAMDYNDYDTAFPLTTILPRSYYYGLANYDATHVVKIDYVYDIPGMRGDNFLAKHVLSGWQISGITTFQSGFPLSVGFTTTTPVDITGTPSVSPRIDVVGTAVLPRGQRTVLQFFNTSVFRLPAVGTIGDAGRWAIRGPGINQWDASLVKRFRVREPFQVQLRAEAYNAFNHTQFTSVNTTAQFNPATGAQVNPGFGQFTGAARPRIMQLAVRFSF
jgi:hypothetical protein